MLTGCGNILDKVTKRNQDAAKTTLTNSGDSNSGEQAKSEDFSITALQTAVKDAKSVKVIAQDSGQSLVLDAAKRKDLMTFLADAGELKENKELAAVVANPEFPAYQIQIEGDRSLKFDVYNSLRFGVGTENVHFNYMEKGDLWKSLNKWLPPVAYKESSLGYLFKASKVAVKGGSFTEEKDVTYARNTLIRTIRGVQLQSSTLPQDAGEPISLTFTVNGKKYIIQVYDEYLKYQNTTYKFAPGKQVIETLLAS